MNQLNKIGTSLVVLAAAALSTSAAQAADIDFGVMELGKEYSYTMFKSFSGEFTAPKSGVLTINGASNVELYTDAAHTQGHITPNYVSYNNYTANVVGGTTYYLISPKEWDNGSIKLTMAGVGEENFNLKFCTPAEDTNFDLASAAAEYLTLEFNIAPKCSTSFDITYKNGAGTWTTASYTGAECNRYFIYVPLQENLLNLMRSGKMLPNNPFYVVIKGLESQSGQKLDRADANGNLTLSFNVGNLPTTITDVKYPEPFLSYWIPGDESAKLEMTLSRALSNNPNTTVELQYGDMEIDNGYYVETLPFTINGNKITADLSGKLRTPETMLPSLKTLKPYMTIRFGNMVDVEGQTVATGAAGAVGSRSYSPSYTVLERANVVADFEPANGTSLKGKNEVSIWMQGLNTLKFDGFKFATETASVVVPVAEATFEAGDTSDEGEYFITIPASMKNQKGVTITLNNVKAADGYDHTEDVKASYDTMTVIFANPENGASMATLAAGTIINIETNYDSLYPEMVVVYDITDLQPEDPEEAIIKTEAYMTRTAAGHYTAEVFGNYKLMQGHQYRVNFTAYENNDALNYGGESLGSSYIIWNGETAPFQYSPLSLMSIDPAEGTRISKADKTINVVFDGLVNLNSSSTFINRGMGMREAFAAITPVYPSEYEGTVYSNEWNLVVPDSYMAELTVPLAISFVAIDQDGKLVKGNSGKEETTFFYYTYEVGETFADFDVYFTDHAQEVTAVSTIWASNQIGILPSYQMAANKAYVMSKTQEIVANVASFIIPLDEKDPEEFDDELNTQVGLVLDKEITTPGAYILYIPENYFNVGSEFNQQNSAEKYWNFEVKSAQAAEVNFTSNPAAGKVESLSSVEIWFLDFYEVGLGSGKATLTIDGGEAIVLGDAEFGVDLNAVVQSLGKEYTADGTYVLSFPKGYFTNQIGDAIDAFTIEYTIGATKLPYNMTLSVPNESNVPELETIEIVFNDYDEISLGSGVIKVWYNNNARANTLVETLDAQLDDDQWNKATITLNKAYTDAGTYTIEIPAGYFQLGTAGIPSQAFNLTYNVGLTGVEIISVDGENVVFDLMGRRVNAENLPAGLYIINGAKVLVK